MRKIVLLDSNSLKAHEEVEEEHLRELGERIEKDGYLRYPLIVEKSSLVILDGEHRHQFFKRKGYKKIPVYLVDYHEVKVYLRRKEILMELLKESILRLAKENKLLPAKTTRHLMRDRPRAINYPLSAL